MKYILIATSAAVLMVLTACEGKKSLDGYPMDMPPPPAYAPSDFEPELTEPVVGEDNDVEEVAVDEVDDAGDDEDKVESEEDEADTDEEVDEE